MQLNALNHNFMKHNRLRSFALAFCATGFLLTSCEKEEVNEVVPVAEAQYENAPFTNYMLILENTEGSEFTKKVQDILKAEGGEIISSIPEIGIAVVSSKEVNFLQNVRKSKENITIVPDYEIAWIPTQKETEVNSEDLMAEAFNIGIGSTEPFSIRLWAMDAIDAPEAWEAGFTGKGASVFVLDSGTDRNSRDLSPNLNTDLSTSFVPNEPYWTRPGRFFNHGTHVAGTIAAAKNNYGVIGVAFEAELVGVKVLREAGGGGAFSWVNRGLVYAGENGADVINMSLGGTVNKNGGYIIDANEKRWNIPANDIQELIRAQQRAVDYAYSKGSTIIASAGNDATNYDGNKSFLKLPAGLNNVIAISATAPEGWHWNLNPNTNYDVPASYTTHGRSLVDLSAPGGDGDVHVFDMIVSTGSGEGFYYSAGTSMAAPHVAGVAALIIAKNGGQMHPHEVEKQLIKSADKVDGNGNHVYFGQGRINAFRAVAE